MALGAPTIRANAGETTSDNQLVITTTSAIADGDYILATAVSNGDGTNEGETNFHTALSVGSVALTKRREQSEAGSSAATSVTVSQWYGVNDSGGQIASGSNVTLDLDAAHADKRVVVISGTRDTSKTFGVADGTALDVDNYISSGGNDVIAESTSGMTSEEHFHWRTAGADSVSTGWTGTAGWTETHTNRQVTGTNGIGMEHRINTSTGETSDPSSNAGNSTEWASILAAYREIAAGGTAHEVNPSDSVTMSDAVVFERNVAFADSVSLSDAIAFVREVRFDDTLSLADAIAFVREVVFADTVGLADNATPERGLNLAVDDSVSLSDALGSLGYEKLVEDVLAIADAFKFDREVTLADAVGIADEIAREFGVTFADSLGIADNATPELTPGGGTNFEQPAADSVTVTDAIAFERGIVISDSVSVSDSHVRQLNGVFLSDAVVEAIVRKIINRFGIY